MLPKLHPAARLTAWLMLAIALQLLPPLFLMLIILLLSVTGAEVRAHWRKLLRRTRILLISLFLVFAYGIPGVPILDQAWLPSREGGIEGGLHVLRLLVLLGALAWLLAPLGHQALMGAIWRLLRPLQRLGVPTDRTVVRLSLVLEYVEQTPEGGNWRQWLLPQPVPGELVPVRMVLPPWRRADTGILLGVAMALMLGGLPW